MFITDIHSLGPDALAGTRFTDAWYWNFDQQNRDWADKFKEKTGSRPSFAHAGNYSAAMNYLEAVQAAGTDASDDVVKNLEGKEINDFFLRNGKIRAEDHRVIHDVYLAEVKPKSDVKEDYDYEKIVTTIPADKAFKPLSESTCKMGQG
jgi:branched-chain amino acid transport system substrate-binding protein